MRSMRPLAKGYILTVSSLGVLLLLRSLVSLGSARVDWPLFAFLTASAAIAQLFPVATPRNQAYELTPIFVFSGMFLLPFPALALLISLAFLPEWVKGRKSWYIQLFNMANVMLDAFAALALYVHLVDAPPSVLDSPYHLAAAAVAAGLYTLVNHLLLAGALYLAQGHSWRETLLFDPEYFVTDAVLSCMGIVLVLLWHLNPWFLSLAIAPLFLIYRGLRTPNLQEEARTDSKTGLYNARHLQTILHEELHRAARFGRPLAVIMSDMDLLRDVNNRYGHLAGDVVLKGVAGIIRRNLREYDVAARFGGEEFAIVLPETTSEQAMAVAERIRHQLESARFTVGGARDIIQVTMSLGVAAFPANGWEAEEIIHQADLAVYYAKLHGRNQVRALSAETGAVAPSMEARLSLEPSTTPAADGPNVMEQPVPDGVGRVEYLGGQLLADDDRVGSSDTAEPDNSARKGEAGQEKRREGRKERSSDLTAPLAFLICCVMGAAVVLLAIVRPWEWSIDWLGLAALYLLATGAQTLAIEIYGRGRISTSAILILAAGFIYGMPAALVMAPVVPVTTWIRSRGVIHRALFDLGDTALSAAAAVVVYQWLSPPFKGAGPAALFAPAAVAAVAYYVVNVGLISLAMGLSEHRFPLAVWKEKFRWLFPQYLVFGMLAMFIVLAYRALGLYGLLAFFVPPVMLRYVMKQYIDGTEKSVNELRRVNRDLVQANQDVANTLQELRSTYGATLRALSTALDSRDSETEGHSNRVVVYTEAIGRQLGLSEREIANLLNGALLHDVGKIGVPDAILRKPGRLTEDEWAAIRTHPDLGYRMLEHIGFLKDALPVVRHHHERYDGSGYPFGLSGEQIPLGARIFAVADTFDAMTSDRPYRRACSVEFAREEIGRCAGTQFDPRVVDAFLGLSTEALTHSSGQRVRSRDSRPAIVISPSGAAP